MGGLKCDHIMHLLTITVYCIEWLSLYKDYCSSSSCSKSWIFSGFNTWKIAQTCNYANLNRNLILKMSSLKIFYFRKAQKLITMGDLTSYTLNFVLLFQEEKMQLVV